MNYQNIAIQLQFAREEADKTQQDAAKYLGVTYQAISNWERGHTKVDSVSLLKLLLFYNVDIYDFMKKCGFEFMKPTNHSDYWLPAEAHEVANSYLNLESIDRKNMVRRLLKLHEIAEPEDIINSDDITYIRHFLTPAAAGYASPIEDEDYKLIPVTEEVPPRADFAITISGDSMEPYIKDGQIVYVERDVNLAPYDVGVFFVDGDAYCKQYNIDANGNLSLLSSNPKREDANKTIAHDSSSSFICLGRVILPHKLPKPIYR